MRDEDFAGYQTPLVARRNLTVTSAPLLPDIATVYLAVYQKASIVLCSCSYEVSWRASIACSIIRSSIVSLAQMSLAQGLQMNWVGVGEPVSNAASQGTSGIICMHAGLAGINSPMRPCTRAQDVLLDEPQSENCARKTLPDAFAPLSTYLPETVIHSFNTGSWWARAVRMPCLCRLNNAALCQPGRNASERSAAHRRQATCSLTHTTM